MKRTLVVAAAAVVALLPAGAAVADAGDAPPRVPEVTPAERVQAYAEPSVVFEEVTWTGWIWDSLNKNYLQETSEGTAAPFTVQTQCTGFVVNPEGYIATAGHCVDRRGDEIEQMLLEQAAVWAAETGYFTDGVYTAEEILGFNQFRVEGAENRNRPDVDVQVAWGATASGIETGEQLPARVVSYQPFERGDVALLKVEESDLNAMLFAPEDDVTVGTEIVSVGYPGSVEQVADADFTPSYKDGAISSETTVQGGLLPVYEISAAVSGGMSGGPTVNLDGEVVGVNSFGITGETQPFNFVRPSGQLQEILAGAGVTNELSAITRQYRRGLDAYFAGNKPAAVRSLNAVVQQQPSNEFAQEYLTKARALPDPPAPSGLSLLPAIGGAVLLLVLLMAAGAFLLLRRRSSAAGPAATPPAGTAPDGPAVPSAPATPSTAPEPPRTPPTTPPPTAPGPATGFVPPTAGMSYTSTADATPSTPQPPAPPARPPAPPGAQPPQAQAGAAESTDGSAAATVKSAPPIPAQRHAFCTSCGTHAEPGQRFCGECGAVL
jgi:serine protease Do